MEGACEGKTLVLGDGNFSFSRALAQRMANPDQLTATTLGREEDALRTHSDAGNNIQALQDKGAVVIFGVDATDLNACLGLRGQIFDHVIFNFPHVGRKAPIKRNRELLRQGQGGTPADQPQRAWHNSWQAVAMAAEAGLILGEVVPFCAEDWEVYMPSGYRSRDKAFHTEGALTHIFAQSCPLAPVTQTAPTLLARVEGRDRIFSKPAGIRHKIGRNLHQKEDHPVAMVTKQLFSLLEETFGVHHLKTEDFSIVCSSADVDMADALSNGQVKTRLIQVKEDGTEGTSADHTCWYLRPSLTTHLSTILQTSLQPGLMHVLTGEVFSHCAISTHTCPVQYQLLGILILPEHTGDSSDSREPATVDNSCQVHPSTIPGQVFVLNQDILPGCRIPGHRVLCFTLNLDRLALLKFSISDVRLLWTEDKRFYEQFRVQSHPATPSVTYLEFSKFPPSYSYDISFWENPDADFCEDDLMMLLRDVSHDVVTEATVIDCYTQPDTGRKSRCYRLTFQAPDRALSSCHVKQIMADLGKRLGQDLGLQVR
ncbi:Ferredoxin-fold anticodon-binding domain-containing protein 1 [Branchiostoma belcheri]|nr:Ferredoxin-fold anticodon-binding domain-containing protein 1 [Branchiostoma belcheri]